MKLIAKHLVRLALFCGCLLGPTVPAQEVRRALPVEPTVAETPARGVGPDVAPAPPAPVAPSRNRPAAETPAVGIAPNVQLGPVPAPAVATGPASVNDTARFLAGMPVSTGSSLVLLEQNPSWQQHASFFDQAWARLAARQFTGIRDWEVNYLPDATQPIPVVFYMFSGPDLLYANQFFPNAGTYILAGAEPIGPLPDVTRFAGPALDSVLQNLQRSLNSVLSFSFFITKEMKTDLQNEQLKGTLPIFYVFLARAGKTITDVSFLTLDRSGEAQSAVPNEKGKGLTPGVRITFTGAPGAPPQTLYYFTTDLSNEGIHAQPGFLKFCRTQGMGASLLKSASYLMFENGFSSVRNFLLEQSKAIVQDDSGIPIAAFDQSKWLLRFFGNYAGPIEIFKQYYQPQLQGLYQQSNPAPLAFGIGYRWSPRQSTLIVATLRGTEVSPLRTEQPQLPPPPSGPSAVAPSPPVPTPTSSPRLLRM
ncbi:MAG TPA: hypothetical protein VH207_04015 [Chthoniobacterales bacterium]|nr:hypothetical protein [Chthoniobacterales bacterium]